MGNNVFKNEFRYLCQIFSDELKLMTRSILFFGVFAVILAGLIFMFPAFIGILVATFIFLVGLFAIVTGFGLRKMGDGKNCNIRPFYPEFEFTKVRSHRLRHYYFQTIRFTRW